MSWTIEYAAVTDVGSWREQNEDACLLPGRVIAGALHESATGNIQLVGDEFALFAVADGIGGRASGEDASRFVLEEIIRGAVRFQSGQEASAAVTEIHMRLNELGKQTERDGMGTTLVLLAFSAGASYILHAGDSRCYRIRRYATQLTRDHSLQVRTGNMLVGEGVITSCIGGAVADITIDVCDLADKISEGDLYLLCSDGLEDGGIDEDALEESFAMPGVDLAVGARQLLDASIKGGSEDNVTIIVARIMRRGGQTVG